MTMKPQLWRVHSYFGPGLPKPTISHMIPRIEDRGSRVEDRGSKIDLQFRSSILDLLSSLLCFFSLALLDHFRLGGGFRRGFRRRLFDAWRDDRGDHGLRIVEDFDLAVEFQVADLELVADAQGRHVDFNDRG